ncbi:MAG TPA: hypothetical protein VMX55_05190 [candidate division Zixibacteria bacterium]|nr:hypothetical protein [candidate division Zixibacteria bacterium]
MGYASQLGTFSITIKKRFISMALPILIISVLSGVCSTLIFGYFNIDAGGGEGPPPATPVPGDTPGSAALNALFYVGIAFIGAFAIFFIFKYGNIKLLKAFFAVAIAVTSFFFVFLFIYATPYYVLELVNEGAVFRPSTEWVILSLAIFFGLLYSALTVTSMVYQITPQPIPQIMAMLFAVLAGTFLATFLPMLASIFIMIGLSIYDIISVFRGPIKKIAEVSEERYNNENSSENQNEEENKIEEKPTMKISELRESEQPIDENESVPDSISDDAEYYYAEYIELGLGDLAFFGMLFSFALLRLGFFAAIGAFVGVVIGAIGTIKLLEKVQMMPGLPLSIGLGLLLAFGVWGIIALTGYSGWGWISPDWLSLSV